MHQDNQQTLNIPAIFRAIPDVFDKSKNSATVSRKARHAPPSMIIDDVIAMPRSSARNKKGELATLKPRYKNNTSVLAKPYKFGENGIYL